MFHLPSVSEDAVQGAIDAALRSPCRKSKRGVAIFSLKTEKVISVGWNHPPGSYLCSEYCSERCNTEVIHAEMMALECFHKKQQSLDVETNDLALIHVKVKEGEPVSSGAPSCLQCSKYLFEENFRGVFLLHFTERRVRGWKFYEMKDFHDISKENDSLRK